MNSDDWEIDFEKRLRAVDWASVQHAFGPAVEVPDELMKLFELGDAYAAWVMNDFFYTRLSHQQTRYSATLTAVPFLVELLEHLPQQRVFLIDYLVDTALGSASWFYPTGYHPQSTSAAYMTGNLQTELYARVQELAFPVFLRLARQSDEPRTQKMALWALGWFPKCELESRPVLESNPNNASRFALQMLYAAKNEPRPRTEEEEEADFERYDELINEIHDRPD